MAEPLRAVPTNGGFAKCGSKCEPILQTRGQMGQGDYFGVTQYGGIPDIDHHQIVDMNDAIRNDQRIACKTCAMATGWGPRDFPNAPGAGRDYMVKRWADMVNEKKTKESVRMKLQNEFGA